MLRGEFYRSRIADIIGVITASRNGYFLLQDAHISRWHRRRDLIPARLSADECAALTLTLFNVLRK